MREHKMVHNMGVIFALRLIMWDLGWSSNICDFIGLKNTRNMRASERYK